MEKSDYEALMQLMSSAEAMMDEVLEDIKEAPRTDENILLVVCRQELSPDIDIKQAIYEVDWTEELDENLRESPDFLGFLKYKQVQRAIEKLKEGQED